MSVILTRILREISWVFSSNKYGNPDYGDFWSLVYPPFMAVGLLSLRCFLYKFLFEPLGHSLGIKGTRIIKLEPNEDFERVYKQWRSTSTLQISSLAKKYELPQREVEKWFRNRRKQDRPSVLKKFCESCWRLTYYSSLFTFGLVVLWKKVWFWDVAQCWSDIEKQVVTTDIWWYYMISLAFYWSLFFGQFFIDVKRKDFWEMFIHHAVTIFLITFSWLAGTIRIGTLVLILHDVGDIPLEAAKIAKYSNYNSLCDMIFVFFAIDWIVTRLGIYPVWILKSTLFDVSKVYADFPAYYTFNAMLVTLLILHCFWTYLLLKIVLKAVAIGKVEKDVRSSSEESD